MLTKAQKQYDKAVSAALICSGKEKRVFLKALRTDVEDYLALEPQATAEQLAAQFGTPQEIAAGFAVNDPKGLAKRLRLRRIILFAVLAVLALYLCFLVVSLIDVHEEAHGIFEEGVLAIQIWMGVL